MQKIIWDVLLVVMDIKMLSNYSLTTKIQEILVDKDAAKVNKTITPWKID